MVGAAAIVRETISAASPWGTRHAVLPERDQFNSEKKSLDFEPRLSGRHLEGAM
jgi:hypothetical protein